MHINETETVETEAPEDEGPGLAELLAEEERNAQAQAEAESAPTAEEVEHSRKLAEQMNEGFLWVVNRTQCPHVDIGQLVDRQKGIEAFQPIAEKWGGEVPPWVQQFMPYAAAGVYVGTTIVAARQAERQVLEAAEQEHRKEAGSGEEPANWQT